MHAEVIVVGAAIGTIAAALLLISVRARAVLGVAASVISLGWLIALATVHDSGSVGVGSVAVAGVFVLVGAVLVVFGQIVWRALDDGPDGGAGS
jgi:hypothetical protein